MTLQAPFVLWWFVPVAAFIVLLYLLKIRRRTVRVPAIFLFPPITTDVRANALWQRLRFHWLMVLQLIAALLLITALARPAIVGRGMGGQTIVFVLDASASMKATDVHPSRFEEGKRRILQWLRNLRRNDHVALILAATEPRVFVPLTQDHRRLRTALDQLIATDAPSDIAAAMRLAVALVAQRPQATIVLVSDGSFPPVTDFSPGNAKLAYEAVGSNNRNAGFVMLDARRQGNREVLFAVLRNFGQQPLRGTLSLFVNGRLVAAKEVSLPAQQLKGETVVLPPTARQATLKWECPEDLLSSDNEVNFVGAGRAPLRVLLVSKGNFFLERALALEPECLVDKAPQVPANERGEHSEGRYDIVIFDGTKPEPVQAKGIWLIGTTDGNFVRSLGKTQQPQILTWEQQNPVLRFVDLSAVLIDSAIKVQPAPWAQAIAEGREGPLMVIGEQMGRRWLFVGFNLLDSDFPLRVGFPIFVANALRWLAGKQRWEQGFMVKAGNTVSLTVPTKQVVLRLPNGRSQSLQAPNHLFTFYGTDRVGIYELQAGNLRVPFAVNLLNSEESDITPKSTITLGTRTVAPMPTTVSWRELWWLMVLLGLLVLTIEWWVFVRWS